MSQETNSVKSQVEKLKALVASTQKQLYAQQGVIAEPLSKGSVGNDVKLLQFALGVAESNPEGAPYFGDKTQSSLVAFTGKTNINTWDDVKRIAQANSFRTGGNENLSPSDAMSIVTLLPMGVSQDFITNTLGIEIDNYRLGSSDGKIRQQYIANVLVPGIKNALVKYNQSVLRAKSLGVSVDTILGAKKSIKSLDQDIRQKQVDTLKQNTVSEEKTTTASGSKIPVYTLIGGGVAILFGVITGASIGRITAYACIGIGAGILVDIKK